MSKISERFAQMSPLKQALIVLKEMQCKLDKFERQQTEPIAIIGMGCRFPGGANTPDMFWQLLQNGVDAIQEVPSQRWDMNAYHGSNSETASKVSTLQGGFLDVEVDGFDADFFGLAPREIVNMDPQQRLILEVAWEALENAGQAPDKLAGSQTGVFIGINTSDYLHMHQRDRDPADLNTYLLTGNTFSIAAGRLSYILGLQGPSVALDTSCSSSLVAIHLACQSLRTRECHLALAGGVHLMLSAETFIVLSGMRALAADGRCKTFDASADGYGRGEGCGIIALKRLSDAIDNGDNILALIRGSAINHDGRSGGLTVPNGLAQQAVVRAALTNAKLKPNQVSYVEVHGTGTALGDPIEIEALSSVLTKENSRERPLIIGSVKTNIGHLEAAAGVASLIKVVLAMQHKEIPPHLNLKNPNPSISWEYLPIVIPTQKTYWSSQAQCPRIAGVSSFGMSGTNAHLVMEEAPVHVPVNSKVERPFHVLTLSAKSEVALQKLASRFEDYLENNPLSSIGNVCFTANTGRSHFSQRLAVVAEELAQVKELLADFAKGETPSGILVGHIPPASPRTKVAFLFTGQGSQYVGMGRQLYETQPTFRKTLERCDELLLPYLKQSLLSLLYTKPEIDSFINETAFAQPALFAIEYALAKLWQSWGVEPAIVMGYGVGEYVAACIAGVFSLEDGLKLIAQRGQLMQTLPLGGRMVAIFADEARVTAAIKLFKGQISIAAINSPENIVISGESDAVQTVLQKLEEEKITFYSLKVSHAFNSHLIEPIIDNFKEIATDVKYSSPRIQMLSNLTGEIVKGEDVAQAEYWCRHLRETVKFSTNIKTLHKKGYELFVEIGPHSVLLEMGKQCLPKEIGIWLPSLHKGKSDWQQILHTLGKLYIHGVEINWHQFDQDYSRQLLQLPTYPFQHSRYWSNASKLSQKSKEEDPISTDWLHEIDWQFKSRAATIKSETATSPKQDGRWLIFADQKSQISAKLEALLKARGETCVMVFSGKTYEISEIGYWTINPTKPEDFQRLLQEILENDAPPCYGIVHCWCLDVTSVEQTTASSLETDQMLTCGSVLHLVQALNSVKVSQLPRLWLISQNAQPVEYQLNSLAVAQAPLWGLGRVIATEHPELWGGLLDLTPDNPEEAAANCLEELLQSDGETEVAFRQGKRYVPRLVHSKKATTIKTLNLRSDGTYLITGGLGGLGLKIAKWMVNKGARHLVLVGRSDPSQYAIEQVKKLNEIGAEIVVLKADVSQESDVQRILADIAQSLPPLLGIMHLAGVLDEGVLLRQNWERFVKVMAPKVAGAWNLHSLTQDIPLEFFVLFSSSASILGVPGQATYSAANTFLDVLVHHRHLQKLPALSINWSPWDEIGIAAGLDSMIKQRWEVVGISPIAPQKGLQVMERLFSQPYVQVGVLSINWSKFIAQFPPNLKPPLLSKINDELQSKVGNELSLDQLQHELLEQLKVSVIKQRRAILVTYIQNCVAKILGRDSSRLPDPQFGFFELGMDSLMTLELRNRLQASLGYSLPSTLTYEYPTIYALTDYLLNDILSLESSVTSKTSFQEDTVKQIKLLTEIEQLSVSELEALVDAELTNLVSEN
jgi:acyl transferase domain-containing protein/acyl carrier protein